MSEITLFSDSSCDITDSLAKKYDVNLIHYYVSFNGEDYLREIKDLPISDFYEKLRASKIYPKTSLPSIDDYIKAFTPYLKEGKPIICVCLSSHFSGSFNAASNARNILLENYPNAQIAIIDSLNATIGQFLLVEQVAWMIRDGVSFEDIVDKANKLRESSRIFFYVDTLDYLENGGRIGKASALLGNVLNVKPVIYLKDGELFPSTKVRGKKKAINKIAKLMKDYVSKESMDHYCFALAHGDASKEDNNLLEDKFNSVLGISPPNWFHTIGVTIGVNTGPDTQGIACIKHYKCL